MKTYYKPLSFLLIFFTFLFASFGPAFKGQIERYVPSLQPDILLGTSTLGSEVINFYYNKSNVIKVTDGAESVEIKFNPNAKEIEYFEIPLSREKFYIRNLSPDYYSKFGQDNNGTLLLIWKNPNEKIKQLFNKNDYLVDNKTSINDKAFSFLYDYLNKKEKEIRPDQLCSANDAEMILLGIESSKCYVRRTGRSEIFSQLLPRSTRIVRLKSKSVSLENNYKFLWSEDHTAIEINENGEWFVADPSYGLAYVKDVNGKRVNVKDLLTIITEKRSNDLIFGLVENGLVYEVKGYKSIKDLFPFTEYYYTEDKIIKYFTRNNHFELPKNLININTIPVILRQYYSTIKYLEDFNFSDRYYRGTDYGNPYFSPERIGLERKIYVYEYDFDLLSKVEKELSNVDRDFALKQIYLGITSGARTNSQRHIALQEFLQKISYHGQLQPMYPDKITVLDPIILLDLTEMRCGHVARIGIDLWKAGGGEGRLFQAGAHISAEIFYDGDWHLLEGDLWENGVSITDQDGSIPSINELSIHPYRIDSLPSILFDGEKAKTNFSLPYPSYYFFNKKSYSTPAQYYYKVESPTLPYSIDRYYGWNNWETKIDDGILLMNDPPYYQPSAVVIRSIEKTGNGNYRITWDSAKDLDNDLIGYRVFIGTKSRGWAYETSESPKVIQPFGQPKIFGLFIIN